jgi:tRNA (cytidine/uridine-2'-O-)-methyltransferase
MATRPIPRGNGGISGPALSLRAVAKPVGVRASLQPVAGPSAGRRTSMLHIVLFQPEIPQNTGNIGRMCALTRSRLHLIHPLGFVINDRNLRRAGMDYWYSLDVHEHADWAAFRASPLAPRRLWLFTTHTQRSYWDVAFADGDGLVFGNESSGAPEWLHAEIGEAGRTTIPQANPELRSLNLSTAAGIACYEALRQIRLTS